MKASVRGRDPSKVIVYRRYQDRSSYVHPFGERGGLSSQASGPDSPSWGQQRCREPWLWRWMGKGEEDRRQGRAAVKREEST